ncbi:hypothetical protein [Leptothrix ochracea]|uniref:hypothetical protein n=1 Tax=Leptothrix ochracea TaxID=735331 RepID=UPI0034E23B14
MPDQTSFQAVLTIMNKFLNSMIKVEAKDVNLKFIFDHFKNYSICGLMLATGFAVWSHPKIYFFWEPLGYLLAALLVLLSWILSGFNFFQGIFAFYAIRNIHAKEAENVSKFGFTSVFMILFCVAFTLIIKTLLDAVWKNI